MASESILPASGSILPVLPVKRGIIAEPVRLGRALCLEGFRLESFALSGENTRIGYSPAPQQPEILKLHHICIKGRVLPLAFSKRLVGPWLQ